MIKAGFDGEDNPRAVFPSIIGRQKNQRLSVVMGGKEYYVGNEAQEKRGILSIKNPIEHGVVDNWDDIEKIWQHTFYNELKIAPEDCPIFLTTPTHSSNSQKEKMVQIMLETFSAPCVYVSSQSVLPLYGCGRTLGTVLESGEGKTEIVPVYEGIPIYHAASTYPVTGRIITDLIMKNNTKGYSFTTNAERIIVRNIKEKLCYVAADFGKEMVTAFSSSSEINRKYELPDGQVISLEQDRFIFSECLFDSSLIQKYSKDQNIPPLNHFCAKGVHFATLDTVMKCDVDIRDRLFEIVVSGGNTMFPGFVDRFKKEFEKISSPNSKIKVIAPTNRNNSVFFGASLFTSLSTFEKLWISKEEYDCDGPGIVHKKSF